jgi:hypothetical protein
LQTGYVHGIEEATLTEEKDMCVDTKGHHWERPAMKSDCETLSHYFQDVDFDGLLDAMSQDGARPLTTDLALVGAMMHTKPDDRGMRYVPFTAVETNGSCNVVKLPVMDQIVEWFENTALGSDMWKNASDWCEKKMGRARAFRHELWLRPCRCFRL